MFRARNLIGYMVRLGYKEGDDADPRKEKEMIGPDPQFSSRPTGVPFAVLLLWICNLSVLSDEFLTTHTHLP